MLSASIGVVPDAPRSRFRDGDGRSGQVKVHGPVRYPGGAQLVEEEHSGRARAAAGEEHTERGRPRRRSGGGYFPAKDVMRDVLKMW